MLTYLFGQIDTECLPTALPNSHIAHKTGEIDHVYHDGGIIYTDADETEYYVLVLLSNDFDYRQDTVKEFQKIATTIAPLF